MSSKFFDTSNLRGDLYGGLTAGVVALPLALAFGEASGAVPSPVSTERLLLAFLPHSSAAQAHKLQVQQDLWLWSSQAYSRH